MTRWLTSFVLLISGLLPHAGEAQDQWAPPSTVGPVQLGAYCPPGHVDAPLYAQLFPKERLDLFGRHDPQTTALLHDTVKSTWIRFDYLYWSIKGAGATQLGANVTPDPINGPFDLSGEDRSRRLLAQDRVGGIRPFTTVVVPEIGEAQEEGLNGFRGNLGIPLSIGDLEANIWILEEFDQVKNQDPFNDDIITGIDNFQIGAVTLLEGGQLSNSTMILFSEDYRATLATDLWGTEMNMVYNAFTPNVSVEVHPILGLQYVNMEEQLVIAGQDMPDPVTVLDHRIQSDTKNQVFGPQVGLRFVSTKDRFTLQTDAKFLLAFNRIENRLRTQQIFSETEDPRFMREDRTRFAPMFDLSVSLKCQATKHISLFVAYEALVGSGFSRAYDNIRYDASVSTTDPPIIGLQDQVDNFYVHGLVLGGEITFR